VSTNVSKDLLAQGGVFVLLVEELGDLSKIGRGKNTKSVTQEVVISSQTVSGVKETICEVFVLSLQQAK